MTEEIEESMQIEDAVRQEEGTAPEEPIKDDVEKPIELEENFDANVEDLNSVEGKSHDSVCGGKCQQRNRFIKKARSWR